MRLLLINPNTTEAMTERMAEVAAQIGGPDVSLIIRTAKRGVPYIASRAEAQIAGVEVLEMLAEDAPHCDAAIIAAFGDPGLVAARELFDLPIVGMAEAAVMTAALLGDRFSVVTFSPLLARWYIDCVRLTGLEARFTGVRCPEETPQRLDMLRSEMRAELMKLATQATKDDSADVVIIGGAPLAGLASEIASETPGILVDPIAAATVQAMGLARLKPSYKNRACRPASKPSVGLHNGLASVISGDAS